MAVPVCYTGIEHPNPPERRTLMYLCKEIQSMERLDGAFLFHTNCADIKVCFVTDEIVRVRVAFDRELAEESYILSTTAWEDRLDGLFGAERTRVRRSARSNILLCCLCSIIFPLRHMFSGSFCRRRRLL